MLTLHSRLQYLYQTVLTDIQPDKGHGRCADGKRGPHLHTIFFFYAPRSTAPALSRRAKKLLAPLPEGRLTARSLRKNGAQP
jgi:hypothetical protein